MGSHLICGMFQSDKYPSCPPGKVPLSTNDGSAQDLLWEYAQRRRSVDAEFSEDLETALRSAGYAGPPVRASAPDRARSISRSACWRTAEIGILATGGIDCDAVDAIADAAAAQIAAIAATLLSGDDLEVLVQIADQVRLLRDRSSIPHRRDADRQVNLIDRLVACAVAGRAVAGSVPR